MIAGAAMQVCVDPYERMRQIALGEFKAPRWLYPLNLVLLQFLFVRLEADLEWSGPDISIGGMMEPGGHFKPSHASIVSPGKYSIGGWSLIYAVLPFTGWRGPYRFIGRKPRRFKISKATR